MAKYLLAKMTKNATEEPLSKAYPTARIACVINIVEELNLDLDFCCYSTGTFGEPSHIYL